MFPDTDGIGGYFNLDRPRDVFVRAVVRFAILSAICLVVVLVLPRAMMAPAFALGLGLCSLLVSIYLCVDLARFKQLCDARGRGEVSR